MSAKRNIDAHTLLVCNQHGILCSPPLTSENPHTLDDAITALCDTFGVHPAGDWFEVQPYTYTLTLLKNWVGDPGDADAQTPPPDATQLKPKNAKSKEVTTYDGPRMTKAFELWKFSHKPDIEVFAVLEAFAQ